jgi:hypothetical protein
MVFRTILIILVIAILMDDSASIKKTVKEEKEDEELARAVNATLEAEEKKRREEEEKKKKEDGNQKKKTEVVPKDKKKKNVENKDEACPPANSTCPIVQPCPPCKNCEACEDCPKCGLCPEVDPCKPCDPCGPCPPIFCQPCPTTNSSVQTPSNPGCPEANGMTVPMAVAVGAVSSILVMGLATAVGLIIRYLPPFISGFVLIVALIMVWYLSSRYPEVARELGERVVHLIREATVTLSHRILAAIQRHQDQVGFPV